MRSAVLLIFLSMLTVHAAESAKTAKAYLGGGCFWCMDAEYRTVPGVVNVVSGFAGGHVANPTYEEVCTETTGHAEVTEIEYDPAKISYRQIVDTFWKAHDPTTLNRQGNDEGESYRSIILYQNEDEKKIAEESEKKAQANFKDPIVTQIVPLKAFYPAEGYHQNYYKNNPDNPYVQGVIQPKLEKFQQEQKQP